MTATITGSTVLCRAICNEHDWLGPARPSRRLAEDDANQHNLVHHLPAWLHA